MPSILFQPVFFLVVRYRNSEITNNDDIEISATTRILRDSLRLCGGSIGTRNYAVVNGRNFTLISGGEFIGDPSYSYDTKHSDVQARNKPYSLSLNTQGSYAPGGSQCFGGGSVDDDWSFSNN